jgi:hypothetical protein
VKVGGGEGGAKYGGLGEGVEEEKEEQSLDIFPSKNERKEAAMSAEEVKAGRIRLRVRERRVFSVLHRWAGLFLFCWIFERKKARLEEVMSLDTRRAWALKRVKSRRDRVRR